MCFLQTHAVFPVFTFLVHPIDRVKVGPPTVPESKALTLSMALRVGPGPEGVSGGLLLFPLQLSLPWLTPKCTGLMGQSAMK